MLFLLPSFGTFQTFLTATCSIPYSDVTNEIKVFAQGSAAEASFRLSASVLFNELHTTPGSVDPNFPASIPPQPQGRFGNWNVLQGYTPGNWSITGNNDYESDSWGTQTSFPQSTVYRIVRDFNTAVCRNLPVSVHSVHRPRRIYSVILTVLSDYNIARHLFSIDKIQAPWSAYTHSLLPI